MLNLLQYQAVQKWTVSFMFCIAKGGTEFWIYSSSGHKENQHSERATWCCLFCKALLKVSNTQSTQVERKGKKMTTSYWTPESCQGSSISGRPQENTLLWRAKKSAREQSPPHFSGALCFTCKCNFHCVPCLESDSKALWMRTIIQSRQAETIPQGLCDVCRKAVQNIAGKWERKKKKKAATSQAASIAETYKAKGQTDQRQGSGL